MNFARLSKSERLQRVAKIIRDGRPHSTLEIIQRARVCAVSAIIAELRANGQSIDCQRVGNIWYYRMKAA